MSNKRRPRRPARGAATFLPVDRGQAVRHLAACLADRTAFVISASSVGDAASSLCGLSSAECFMDNGTDLVFKLSGDAIAAAALMDELMPGAVAAVFTVPKTVPAAQLAGLLRISADLIPADGSQDLIVLHRSADRIDWPVLLVEALALVDPETAMQLAANDLRNLS